MGIEEDLFRKRTDGINSHLKGKKNENALANILTRWTGHRFKRVPASGGLGWADCVNVCGDLVCVDTKIDFPFAVETKAYKALNLTPILRDKSKVYRFWEQAKRDADRAGKKPLLIIRENGMPSNTWHVFVDAEVSATISEISSIDCLYVGLKEYIYGYQSKDFFSIDYKLFT